MNLKIRFLDGETICINVCLQETVEDVKQKICKNSKKHYPKEELQFFYKGALLDEHATLHQSNVVSDSFLVCFTNKKTVMTTLANEYETSSEDLSNLLQMGFNKVESKMALQLSNNCLPSAIEIIMSGVIEKDKTIQFQETHQTKQPTSVLDFLRRDPQFQQTALETLGSHSVGLLQQINENPTDFVRLLNEPIENNALRCVSVSFSRHHSQTGFNFYMSRISLDPFKNSMENKTEFSSNESLQKLIAAGFDEQIVLEAYLACAEDEENTLNFLLEDN